MFKRLNFLRNARLIAASVAITALAFGVYALKSWCFRPDPIEIESITRVLDYTKDADLVIFDIDGTLITWISRDDEGNQIDWGKKDYFGLVTKYAVDPLVHTYKDVVLKAVAQGGRRVDEARVEKALREYFERQCALPVLWKKYIYPRSVVVLVQKEALAVIDVLKKQHIPVMLYTSRKIEDQQLTEKELAQAGFVFNSGDVYNKSFIVQPSADEHYGFAFANGILYWVKNYAFHGPQMDSKTSILVKFFDKINYHPKKLVFVDDMKVRIHDMRCVLKKAGIEASVLWYHLPEDASDQVKKLTESDLRVINFYLPRGWDKPVFDVRDAVAFITRSLIGVDAKKTQTIAR